MGSFLTFSKLIVSHIPEIYIQKKISLQNLNIFLI